MPFGGLIPRRSNAFLSSVGMNTSRISLFTDSSPPTSDHSTLGTSTRTSLIPLGSISVSALVKSSMFTFNCASRSIGMGLSRSNPSMFLLRHLIPASRARDARSAPTNPWVTDASLSMDTSSVRGIPLRWTSRISLLPSLPGMPISISRSNLPGLLSAGSMAPSLLVAAMTTTSPFPDDSPSISVSS